ncbi:MAG: hypothetical protein ACI4CS_04705 [Candidatus Weimeria sp.]
MIGGVLALEGKQPADKEFWKAAEFIDKNGPQHLEEVPEEQKDKLNAYNYMNKKMEKEEGRVDLSKIEDITELVHERGKALSLILGKDSPEKTAVIEEGRKWAKDISTAIESCLVSENEHMRVFSTNGPSCSAAYYSPNQKKVIPAIVSFNQRFNSISISFPDDSLGLSAEKIAQEMWGPGAGGHPLIAGSPRGRVMTAEEFKEVQEKVEKLVIEREKALELGDKETSASITLGVV